MSKRTRRPVASALSLGAVGTACTLVLVLAGCAGGTGSTGSAGSAGGSSAPAETDTGSALKVALYSEPQASVVALHYGVDTYAGDFDLDLSVEENVTIFDSNEDFVDAARDGGAEIMATSVSAILGAREDGDDLKIFCPYVGMDDFVLAGANGVTTVGQLFDPATRVGIDNPGGAGSIVLNALLSGVGETRDIPDIPNPQMIESSNDRTAEWAAGRATAPPRSAR